MDDYIRVGIVGIGNMGQAHAMSFLSGSINNARLVAVCDIDEDKLSAFAKNNPSVEVYNDYLNMIKSGLLDAVIIATPHYLHPEIAICAFDNGLHVLSEKPAGVYVKQVVEMNNAAKKSGKTFCIMFNQRTNPLFQKAREMVKSGELGLLKRFCWIVTNWYRTQYYYNSGSWRGSYSGEGGGVLLNQAPHNLDIWQWIFGMPDEISAHIFVGKNHDISVEDEAEIFATYKNGATAQFITSTGEYPGTNRLEISGDLGKIVLENGKLTHYKLSEHERDFCFTASVGFYQPKVEISEYVPDESTVTGHKAILQNFVNHILFGDELLSSGFEGINELTISNAAYMSGWTGKTVHLPLTDSDNDEYRTLLQKHIANEKGKTKSVNHEKMPSGEYNDRWNVRW